MRSDHVDNGPIRVIQRMTCFNCGAFDAYVVSQNLVYEFEGCTRCDEERPPTLLEPLLPDDFDGDVLNILPHV